VSEANGDSVDGEWTKKASSGFLNILRNRNLVLLVSGTLQGGLTSSNLLLIAKLQHIINLVIILQK
jgi:hypothetical protein